MTSGGGGGGAFFEQFIEEYYSECDEHMATARRVLLALEGHATVRAPDPALLRELFRSLHTLKGLSGMVGDASAERLAHALEGSLRAAERGAAPLAPTHLDALFAGLDLLERCIGARRTGGAAPDVRDAVAALGRAANDDAAPAVADVSAPAAADPPTAAPSATAPETIWDVTFVPSAERAARGVGVDAVRARLRELGTLLDARPRMDGGSVTFEFRVAVTPGRAPDAAWAADGLRWAVAAAPAPSDGAPGDGSGAASGAAFGAAFGAASFDAPPMASAAAALPGIAAASSVVRVDLARLDGVMRLVGDLVVSRSRLDDLLRVVERDGVAAVRDALDETNAVMERQLRRLRESVMRIRLVPVGEVFERLRFAARDAIRESGKAVTLVFEGQTTEIDKLVVDRMLEPLLHLVRNAVSHGIESPDARRALGKPAEGRLTLRAAASGDRILVEVEDDGAGIDLARVTARGRARGLVAPDETLTPDRLLDVLCAPGFSTRDTADLTSGRGVGMDVVHSAVHALAGELTLHTVPGRGTRFVVELPLTLMIIDALLVDVGGEQMAVPQPSLREVLHVEAAAIVRFENNDVIPYRDAVLPLVHVARLFGFPAPAATSAHVLVVGHEAAPVGLLVDRVRGLREIVVHPIADPLATVPGVAGATELGDGRVSLILDVAALLRLAAEGRPRHRAAPVPPVRRRRADA